MVEDSLGRRRTRARLGSKRGVAVAIAATAIVVQVGCRPSTSTATQEPAADPTSSASSNPGACAAGFQVVSFKTDDGVELQADFASTGTPHGPGVVLLHMVPPANDRTNYPRAFVDKLVAKGLTVLNVDRRGAGGSKGTAKDAYMGPNGKLDAKAAVSFLTHHPCAVDPAKVAIVGASNGTTTALDYTNDPATTNLPVALVFLTGGTYTENQTKLAESRVKSAPVPTLFVFSKEERAWSVGAQAGARAAWTFREYDPGDHGTRMFGVQPAAMDVVADFVATAVR